MVILYYVSMGLGITLGYHRLFAHRSFKAPRWLRLVLGALGCLALQAGPIRWVLTHRLHHRFADTASDPHSPKVTFVWAHVRWNFYWEPSALGLKRHRRVARELFADPDMRRLERWFLPLNAASICVLLFIGVVIGGPWMGTSLLIWGFALRVVLVWHGTWFVNSATHRWGRRQPEFVVGGTFDVWRRLAQ
jgi:stearoyl-CoA desaturase (delta-9 desaturase)